MTEKLKIFHIYNNECDEYKIPKDWILKHFKSIKMFCHWFEYQGNDFHQFENDEFYNQK